LADALGRSPCGVPTLDRSADQGARVPLTVLGHCASVDDHTFDAVAEGIGQFHRKTLGIVTAVLSAVCQQTGRDSGGLGGLASILWTVSYCVDTPSPPLKVETRVRIPLGLPTKVVVRSGVRGGVSPPCKRVASSPSLVERALDARRAHSCAQLAAAPTRRAARRDFAGVIDRASSSAVTVAPIGGLRAYLQAPGAVLPRVTCGGGPGPHGAPPDRARLDFPGVQALQDEIPPPA
jgi:hypothetical protein